MPRAGAQGPKQGFDDFRLLKTRNIFDPNRRATRVESRESRGGPATRITRANSLALTGTMVTESRTLAFFGGTRSEYNKVIGVGDSVADYKVKAIAPTEVQLEQGGKVTVLTVGKLLTLEGTVEVAADAPPEVPAVAAPASDAAAPAPTNDKNDVRRRMEERRAKEMNK